MSQVSVFCPRCGQHKPTTITLSHAARGITFQGCGDCLTNELDALASFRSAQCNVCGTAKVVVVMGDPPAKRVECPVHIHGRLLLGQALRVLAEREAEVEAEASPLVRDIRQALGVKT